MPYASIYWPQRTRILVQVPGIGWRVPCGEPLTIRAKIDGEIPAAVDIVYRSGGSESWITERMAVDAGAAEARFAFSEMNEPVTFYCAGGDDRERRKYSVTVAERPLLTGVKATYTYPRYMRLPRKITPTGQLAAPEGTEVKLEFTASTELAEAVIRFDLDGEEPVSVPVAEIRGQSFSYELSLTRSGSYTVELTDRDNLRNGRPERCEIRVEPDSPPEVTLQEPIQDVILTPSGRIRVKFKAKDDYNLTELTVMLGPVGTPGQPLTDRITGPFWDSATTLHPAGEAEFDLDFKTQAETNLKHLNIRQGAELELWIRAVDCNPSGKGITESVKVRVSVLQPTDFMDAVVLRAKDLMGDARVGWYSAAGACHDGTKWVKEPKDDKVLGAVLDQEAAAERAAAALTLRFPEIVQHMQRNRMQELFMSKRLDRIGARITDLGAQLPAIARKIAAGQPESIEENQPDRRRAKMAKALEGVLADQNKVAWQMRILYDRLADWVALQSALLKTRRIEELQREINAGTDRFVKKTGTREARELDDAEVRAMRELGGQQQTVLDMEEAVEKELTELLLQADRDGRRKLWEALAKAYDELRRNRIRDKLKQASTFILDARGDMVRNDQKLVLEVVATVNRGLIKAGEEVPEDPPASMLTRLIDDPRDREEAVAKIKEPTGEAVEAEAYKQLGRLDILRAAAADSLDETLEQIALRQEDARNRSQHVGGRTERGPRYTFLRTGLLSHRQADIITLLGKAVSQVKDYGQSAATAKDKDAPLPPDPAIERTRERLNRQIQDYLACAEDANRMLRVNDYGALAVGLQNHIFCGVRELRTLMQETEKKHSTQVDRQATKYLDPFGQPYLLREKNLDLVVDEGKYLEWALALQSAAQRESEMIAEATNAGPNLSAPAKTALDRLIKSSRGKCEEAAGLIVRMHSVLSAGIQDPAEPERENEKVKSRIQERVLSPLNVEPFHDCLAQFERKEYRGLVTKQEGLRRNISGVLVSLIDLLGMPVPPKQAVDHLANLDTGEVVAGASGFIEYRDEQPAVLADLIEKEGDWIDRQTGGPEVRKELVRRLREMPKFDPRHARLQSAYFQAIAQHFQAQARARTKEHTDDDKKPPEPEK
jgi:hypothetical protein